MADPFDPTRATCCRGLSERMRLAQALRMSSFASAAMRNPEYGRGNHTIEDDEDDLAAEREAQGLGAWLEHFLEKPSVELPKPPTVALEIVELSRRPNVRIEELAALLEREPLLAAKVLRLANSAMYGGSGACATLKQALVRVGLAKVRDVVMEAAFMMTVIRAQGFDATLERIRKHSAAVAWLSRLIGRQTPMDAENAFLIGLLHDVGLSIGLIGLCEYLKKEQQVPKLTPARWLAVEQVHEAAGERVLKSWGLPPQLTFVVRNHHTLIVQRMPHPSVAIVRIAERLATEAGWTVMQDESSSGVERIDLDECERAMQVVSLSQKQLEAIRKERTAVLETLGAQFEK